MSRSGIAFPCHGSKHPLSSHPTITSCGACTFKNGQIFALVQILHPFHRGQLQTHVAEIASKPQKRLSRHHSDSTSDPNRIRTVARAGRIKAHQSASRLDQTSEKIERDTNTPFHISNAITYATLHLFW